MANNYKAVFKIFTHIELKKGYTDNGTQVKLSDRENINGVTFNDYVATDVKITEDTLERFKKEPAVRSIGEVKEIRYKTLEDFRKQL